MLNQIIQLALQRRVIVFCLAVGAIVGGLFSVQQLPVDVLPDLTRPRVVIISESPGLAPEEVERLVTIPLETAVNGAAGVIAVRSQSDVGLSVIYVEFDWGTDIYRARQVVTERVALAREQLPNGIQPRLGPLSSLLGQIMLIGMWSETGVTDPMEIRTLAEWVVKKRLQQIPGISEVICQGGGLKQYHVLLDIHLLHKFEVTVNDVAKSLDRSNQNVNGGYVDRNSMEFLVRGVGRIRDIESLKKVVVKSTSERAVLLENVASIEPRPQPKRGDAAVNGYPAVVLTIQKQPSADTRRLSEKIEQALEEVQVGLPEDVRLKITYQQREFIDHSVSNVVDALRDGAIMVVLVLFLFLLNARTTLITLTAIPVSIFVTAIVFQYFQLSINVMTLGGIAIALGELVDDAIVDVENIFRRLRENAALENPRPILRVIFDASIEVRNAIVVSTILVVIVFAPLFALSGISGSMFIPLGVAYIVSILMSTVVSLTLTPVMSFYLLGQKHISRIRNESLIIIFLKKLVSPVIRISLNQVAFSVLLLTTLVAVAISILISVRLGQEWIPKFDEGSTQLNLMTSPGTSLATSNRVRRQMDGVLNDLIYDQKTNPEGFITFVTAKTGRAENDEHVMGVNMTEYTISLVEHSGKSRKQIIDALTKTANKIPSAQHEIDQPIRHYISHLISGSTAEIAIKIFGDDLDALVRKGAEIRKVLADVPGIKPAQLEPQQIIPQLRIEPDYEQLAAYKLDVGSVFDIVETAMQGRKVSKFVEQERTFDIVIRFEDEFRESFEELARIPIELPDGGVIPLSTVARIYEYGGPNTINRENARRRVNVRVYTDESDLGTAVANIKNRIAEKVEMPNGYYIQYGGQFEAQQQATRRILILSCFALAAVFAILYSTYQSVNIVFQILLALPIAFVGGVLALHWTGQNFTTSAMVGFISLGGIATRNGLLLVSNYLDVAKQMGGINRTAIVTGSLDRMAPVLMTALTTSIALFPLLVAGNLPGREILYPVATVIVGGLITSTTCEFLIRPGLFYFFGPSQHPEQEDTEIFA
ncbi:MAG: efflux RND transporter permease subunit [Planctomycetota bacterium]